LPAANWTDDHTKAAPTAIQLSTNTVRPHAPTSSVTLAVAAEPENTRHQHTACGSAGRPGQRARQPHKFDRGRSRSRGRRAEMLLSGGMRTEAAAAAAAAAAAGHRHHRITAPSVMSR